ncbi:hypothetical protein [Saccharothrix sp. ALI-22-I]|uniref:hypothetical protein n=1 Tax=Saccharothrix sp. ALI-22-I TaxID=1933778 RepID=UPI00117B2992|nr:hypothetical protein [Saccharothrix sp. ALI-22-I]
MAASRQEQERADEQQGEPGTDQAPHRGTRVRLCCPIEYALVTGGSYGVITSVDDDPLRPAPVPVAGGAGDVGPALPVAGGARADRGGGLAHVFTATALNLIRLDAWWSGKSTDQRSTSHLARLDLAA